MLILMSNLGLFLTVDNSLWISLQHHDLYKENTSFLQVFHTNGEEIELQEIYYLSFRLQNT